MIMIIVIAIIMMMMTVTRAQCSSVVSFASASAIPLVFYFSSLALGQHKNYSNGLIFKSNKTSENGPGGRNIALWGISLQEIFTMRVNQVEDNRKNPESFFLTVE